MLLKEFPYTRVYLGSAAIVIVVVAGYLSEFGIKVIFVQKVACTSEIGYRKKRVICSDDQGDGYLSFCPLDKRLGIRFYRTSMKRPSSEIFGLLYGKLKPNDRSGGMSEQINTAGVYRVFRLELLDKFIDELRCVFRYSPNFAVKRIGPDQNYTFFRGEILPPFNHYSAIASRTVKQNDQRSRRSGTDVLWYEQMIYPIFSLRSYLLSQDIISVSGRRKNREKEDCE